MTSLCVKFQPSSTPPSDRFWWGVLVVLVLLVVLLVTGVKQSQLLVLRLSLEFDNTLYMRRTLGAKHLFLKRSVWREMFVLHHLGEELCVILTLFEEKCWCSTPVCATYLVWEGHVDRVLMLPAAPTGLHCLCYPGKEGAKWRMGGQPERRVQRLPASIYFGNKSLLLLLNH